MAAEGVYCVRFMSKLWAIVGALLISQTTRAQVAQQDDFYNLVRQVNSARPTVSTSRQFEVFKAPEGGWPSPDLNAATETNYVQLDPALLVVACERIKAAVLRDLLLNDTWHGKVRIYLHRAHNLNEPVICPPPQDPNTYIIRAPDRVERSRLVAAVVTVLLEEMANRNAARPAEIPVWLVQGLTREVMQEHPHDLVESLPPVVEGGARLMGQIFIETNTPPLEHAREVLHARQPLTLDQLAWPEPGQAEDEAYRSSAQLLVCELLQTPQGRPCFWAFLPELTKHLNWQLAFMEAFKPEFGSRLELEKWWALCVVQFTGRDLQDKLADEDSWERLDEVLRAWAQVRTSPDEVPEHAAMKLQNVISTWSPAMQEATVRNAVQYLAALQGEVSEQVEPFVESYRQTLELYVKDRDKSGLFHNKKKSLRVIGLDEPALLTVRKLDALDARRQQLEASRPLTEQVTATAVNR
jgi:hypothetical protein